MCSPSQRSCLVTTPTVTCTQVVNTRRHVPFSSVADYTDIFWAQHYWQCGQPDKARNKLTTALAHFTRTQDAVGIGKSLTGLSAVSLAQGCYDRALAYSQAATAILEDTDAKHDYAIALYQLGVSHFELQHWPQAEKILEQALTQFYTLSTLEQENRTLLYLGRVYAEQQKLLFALACYESVLDSLITNPFLENRRDLLGDVLKAVAQLSQHKQAGKAAIAGLQSILEEYSLAAYHLQIAAHLQPSRQS